MLRGVAGPVEKLKCRYSHRFARFLYEDVIASLVCRNLFNMFQASLCWQGIWIEPLPESGHVESHIQIFFVQMRNGYN